MRARLGALLAGALALAGVAPAAAAEFRLLDFTDLAGWSEDDQAGALRSFNRSCDRIRAGWPVRKADWQHVCARARVTPAAEARAFFEAEFRPVLVGGGSRGLLTGYYEPVLQGSRVRTEAFRHPVYAPPPDLPRRRPWLTRAEIDGGALEGRALELVWLRDPVQAFFLHIQGSGRIELTDGSVVRLGFAARNNHPYRSVGQHILAAGLMPPGRVSAEGISDWVREDPDQRLRVLHHNPSYIFFRERKIDPALGPLGSMEVPLVPGRSLAVDAGRVPLGAPVWVETEARSGPFRRLMVAQDTGSAIRGSQRGDIFFGWGAEAYREASVQRGPGRLVQLLPRRALDRLGR